MNIQTAYALAGIKEWIEAYRLRFGFYPSPTHQRRWVESHFSPRLSAAICRELKI